jgi:hypothetical protein
MPEQKIEIAKMTKEYYNQKAVMYYEISKNAHIAYFD